MKNRDYKSFAPDSYYHVFNRGVAKQNIFLDEQDYEFFLYRLEENLFPERKEEEKYTRAPSTYSTYFKKERYVRKLLPTGSFDLVSYCLMPNHFHLLLRQNKDVKISDLILRVCGSYSKYFNKKYDRVGSLFQDQFKAILVDDNKYLLWLSAYIHQNPKEADMVDDLKKWRWSSLLDYLEERDQSLCKKDVLLEQFNSAMGYANMVNNLYVKDNKELNSLILDL